MEIRDVNKHRVLVTGIGGFLGGHVAACLLQQGHFVRGSVRSMEQAPDIEKSLLSLDRTDRSRLQLVRADLRQEPGWAEAVDGCSYVVHTASPFPSRAPKSENEIIVPARDGALRVLRAARNAGVHRVVFTSSIAAIIYGSGTGPYTEEHWSDPQNSICTPYYKSKTLAERAVWEFAQSQGLETTVLNPGFILGPVLYPSFGTSVEVIVKLMRGEYPGIPQVAFPTVDVRDVAEAHVQALTDDKVAGQRLVLGGPVMPFRDIAQMLRDKYPNRAGRVPRRTLPNWFMRLVAQFDLSARTIVSDLARDNRVDDAKARRLLGWKPRPIEATVFSTAESLKTFGLV